MHRPILARGLTGLLSLGWCAVAHAEISCPDQVQVQQQVQPPDGWTASYSQAPAALSAVTLFDGPPANRVSLKYDKRRQSGRELILTWALRSSPRNTYLQCSYERTTAQLSIALPPGTRECQVVFDRTTSYAGGVLPVKRMFCR